MDLAEQVVGLLAVFGLLATAVWAFGRKSGRSLLNLRKRTAAKGLMLVADRLVLTPQHTLHIIRFDDRTLLVATHPQGVTFEPAGAQFRDEFRTAMRGPQEQGE